MIRCIRWEVPHVATSGGAYARIGAAMALYLCVAVGDAQERTTGPLAFITNQDENTVSIISLDKRKVVRTLELGWDPNGVAIDERRRLVFVTSTKSREVSSIDPDSLTLLKSVISGYGPVGIVADSRIGRIYVADAHDKRVRIYDATSLGFRGEYKTGRGAAGLALAPDGRHLFVANQDDHNVSVISTVDGLTLARITLETHLSA